MGEMCYRVSGMELVRQKWETKKGEREMVSEREREKMRKMPKARGQEKVNEEELI